VPDSEAVEIERNRSGIPIPQLLPLRKLSSSASAALLPLDLSPVGASAAAIPPREPLYPLLLPTPTIISIAMKAMSLLMISLCDETRGHDRIPAMMR